MVVRLRVVIRSWASSIGDLVQYLLMKAKEYRLFTAARVGAGLFCFVLASYLVVAYGGFFQTTTVPAEPPADPGVSLAALPSVEPRPVTRVNIDETMVDDLFPRLEERTPIPKLEPEPANPHPVDPATMEWPLVGTVAVNFGWYRHPEFKDWRFSPGVVIAAPEGVPVRAVLPGVVTRVGYTPDRGLVAVLDHGSGWTTSYGYLTGAEIKTGDTVSQGQVIARVGTRAEGTSGLFLGIQFEGEDIDPRAFLR